VRKSDQAFFLGIAEQGDAAIHLELFVDIVQVGLNPACAMKRIDGKNYS